MNSVFNSSEGNDITVNAIPIVLQFSAYSDIAHCEPCGVASPLHPESAGNIVQAMDFNEQAVGDLSRFVRVAQSTLLYSNLIDSGASQNLLLYPFDVVGYPRLSGSAQDRGAFEVPNNDMIFFDGFEQAE